MRLLATGRSALAHLIDVEAELIRFTREGDFETPIRRAISSPDEHLIERFHFWSHSIVYLNNILRPHISNITRWGRAHWEEKISFRHFL